MKHTPRTPALAALFSGRAVAPIGYIHGRPVWPIAGGAEDPPEDSTGAGDNDSGGDENAGDNQGYPAGTPVKDMTAEQRAAYYKHQAQKHEDRNKALLGITGGKYGDDLKAQLDELETLRNAKRTDGEKAVEDAKNQTRVEVRQEFGTKLVAAEFRAALAHLVNGEDTTRRDQIIEGLNLSAYLTEAGDVDTAKVTSYAATIAPADKGMGNGREHDYGAGRRREVEGKTGVKAGAEMFAATRSKSTNTSS